MCYIGLTKKNFFNFTFLKYKSKIIINTIDIKSQYSDKFSFPININNSNINYGNFFSKNQLENVLKHGLLKTDYLLNYNDLNLGTIESINVFTFNTFTSKKYTDNYKNTYLGKSLNGDNEQYLNLKKIIFTEQENNLLNLNNSFFKKFYPHYFSDSVIKNEVNSILIDRLSKYSECLNLINVKYQDACLQSVNLFYKTDNYFFIISTIL